MVTAIMGEWPGKRMTPGDRHIPHWNMKILCWANEMAQQVTTLAVKPDSLSLTPGTHRVEGEN